MGKLPNIHPGEVLLEEFLLPMNISAYRSSGDFAKNFYKEFSGLRFC
jgi:plasmid maintenance system antidote protein VapI